MNELSNIGKINALVSQGVSFDEAVEIVLGISKPEKSEPNLIDLLINQGYSKEQAVKIASGL